jgi:hypothetical protein
MDDGVAQVVECLPSKGEALSSNPTITKKKKKKKKHTTHPILSETQELIILYVLC